MSVPQDSQAQLAKLINQTKAQASGLKNKKQLAQKLQSISDETICQNKQLDSDQKTFFLKTKQNNIFSKNLTHKKNSIYHGSYKLVSYKRQRVFVDFITSSKGNDFTIEGYIENNPLPDQAKLYLMVDNRRYEVKQTERRQREKWLGNIMYDSGGAFAVNYTLSLSEAHKIWFAVEIANKFYPLRIKTGEYTRLSPLSWSYRRDGKWLFTKRRKSIAVKPYAKLRHGLYELRFLLRLLFNWQLRHAVSRLVLLHKEERIALNSPFNFAKEVLRSGGVVVEAIVMLPRAYLLRAAYYIENRRKTRPIWLISDRATAGGDNGEALFRYIAQQTNCPADVYFVVFKKTTDFRRLQQYGKVLNQTSFTYKLKVLLADKIISSQADIETINPFVRQINHFVDLYNFDFIFLQHGIIRHDLSKWLNRYNRNIRLFITSAEKEYNSIFTNPYYYPNQNVLLSGLARFDYLENKPEGKLILCPTYRNRLAPSKTNKKGERKYDSQFKNTEYYKFYNNFMNDSRILAELKNQNMIGEFYLHPVFEAQRADFTENETFNVMRFPYDYKKAFSEGELLISDHSSVVFDFAYLKKPVLYAHFDADTFFDGHSYGPSNFFSDENDGFGKVTYDYESLVKAALEALKDKHIMPPKYQKRVENFFYKTDNNNSRRVYNAILKSSNATDE